MFMNVFTSTAQKSVRIHKKITSVHLTVVTSAQLSTRHSNVQTRDSVNSTRVIYNQVIFYFWNYRIRAYVFKAANSNQSIFKIKITKFI